LVFGDQLRIEAASTIPRDVDLELAGIGYQGLAAVAVAAVSCFLVLAKMMIHLGTPRPLGKRLFQRIQQTALFKNRAGIAAGKQLIEKFMRDHRFFAS